MRVAVDTRASTHRGQNLPTNLVAFVIRKPGVQLSSVPERCEPQQILDASTSRASTGSRKRGVPSVSPSIVQTTAESARAQPHLVVGPDGREFPDPQGRVAR